MMSSETKLKTESIAKQVQSFEQLKFEFMDSMQQKGPSDNP